MEWIEASGRGTVYSFTVIRQNYSRPFRDWIPYVVALVDLEEGPRVMTNIVDCEPDDVQHRHGGAGALRSGLRRGRDRPVLTPNLSRPAATPTATRAAACPGVLGMGSFGMAPPA